MSTKQTTTRRARRRAESESRVAFSSNDLYTQSGFKNGGVLAEVFPNLTGVESRDLLKEVLQTHVIPKLEQDVQTLHVQGVNNPLRAVNVDGESVRWLTPQHGEGPRLSPATISVTHSDIIACAAKLKIKAPETDPTP